MVRSGGQQRRGGGAADTHERPEGSPSRTQKKKQRRAAARGDQGSDFVTQGSIAGLSEEAADDVGVVAMEDAEGEVRRLFEGEEEELFVIDRQGGRLSEGDGRTPSPGLKDGSPEGTLSEDGGMQTNLHSGSASAGLGPWSLEMTRRSQEKEEEQPGCVGGKRWRTLEAAVERWAGDDDCAVAVFFNTLEVVDC